VSPNTRIQIYLIAAMGAGLAVYGVGRWVWENWPW
jgi:hypothetical protein